jgi:hypothetical protein
VLLNVHARASFRIKYLADRTRGYNSGRCQEHYCFQRDEGRLDSWASCSSAFNRGVLWLTRLLSQALTSFTNQALKGVPQNQDTDLLEKYQEVSKDDVLQVLRQYFLPLFDASTSVVVSVTAPGKAQEISEGLKDAGFVVERRTLEVDNEEGSESGSDSESDESK